MQTTPTFPSRLVVQPVQNGAVIGSRHSLMITDTATGERFLATRMSCTSRRLSPMWRTMPLGSAGCGGCGGVGSSSGSGPGGIGSSDDGRNKPRDPHAPRWSTDEKHILNEDRRWIPQTSLCDVRFCIDHAGTNWKIFVTPDNMDRPLRTLEPSEAGNVIAKIFEQLTGNAAPASTNETHTLLQDIFLKPFDQLPLSRIEKDAATVLWNDELEVRIQRTGHREYATHNLFDFVRATEALPPQFAHMISRIRLIDDHDAKPRISFVHDAEGKPTPRDEWAYDGRIDITGIPAQFDPYVDLIRAASLALFSDTKDIHQMMWMLARHADGAPLTGRNGYRNFTKGMAVDVANMLREGEPGETRMDWVKKNPHLAMLIAALLSHPLSEPYAGFELYGPVLNAAKDID